MGKFAVIYNSFWPQTQRNQTQQWKPAVNPPGSSSLLVMSCSDVTSCSSGAWITKRMLPSRHSKQPNLPKTFSTSPSRWEDKIALKGKENHVTLWVSASVQLPLIWAAFWVQLIPDEDTQSSQRSHQSGGSKHVGSKIANLSCSHCNNTKPTFWNSFKSCWALEMLCWDNKLNKDTFCPIK